MNNKNLEKEKKYNFIEVDRNFVVLSDIHSNLIALEAALKKIEDLDIQPEKIFINGDIISLGPWPDEVLSRLGNMKNIFFICGNNDRYIRDEIYLKGDDFHSDTFSKVPEGIIENLKWSRENLRKENFELLKKFKSNFVVKINGKKILISHSTPEDDEKIVHPKICKETFLPRYEEMDYFVMGHIHRPFIYVESGKTYINCGSLGASLDGNNMGSFLTFKFKKGRINSEIIRFKYDIEKVVEKLEERKVPFRNELKFSLVKASFF